MSTKTRAKKSSGKKTHLKLPPGATDIIKKTSKDCRKDAYDQKVVELVEDLVTQTFKPCSARPRSDLFGYFIICRWYSEHKSWAVLYVERGFVGVCLDQIFSPRQKTPIGYYLASFPKRQRNLIWLKWTKDPFYPYEAANFDQIQTVISEFYNSGVKPPFSEDLELPPKEEELPNDFSIIPNWDKSTGKKKAKGKPTATS